MAENGLDNGREYIRTVYGRRIYFDRPADNDFDILDIAHALGNNCRWTGHCSPFYSVAEHCIHVAELLPMELKLTGLLHDAAEAYVHDTPSPLKAYLRRQGFDAFDRLEHEFQSAIYAKFGCDTGKQPIVKAADLVMLRKEAKELMGFDLAIPGEPEKYFSPREDYIKIRGLDPDQATEEYWDYFKWLEGWGLVWGDKANGGRNG